MLPQNSKKPAKHAILLVFQTSAPYTGRVKYYNITHESSREWQLIPATNARTIQG